MYAPELTRGGVQADQTLKESLLHTTASHYQYSFIKKARVRERERKREKEGERERKRERER